MIPLAGVYTTVCKGDLKERRLLNTHQHVKWSELGVQCDHSEMHFEKKSERLYDDLATHMQ